MPDSIVMIRQKTTDLKRRFRERTAERRNRKNASRDEAELEKRTIFRNSSSEDSSVTSKSSNMLSFAIASSTIASSCNSGTESSKSSHYSNLYRRSSKKESKTIVVHPNIYKRDIYLASRKHHKSTKPTVQKVINDRGVMSDVSNGPDEAKTSLPAYSLTGSMLCRELERGKIRSNGTRATQNTMSPQKPVALPPNTIMASMLFRTLEQEEKSASTGSTRKNQYGVPIRTTVPREVIQSPANTVKSGVSELTVHTTHSKESKEDPSMVKASNNLLRILQSNQFQSFDAKPRTSLYEA